MITTPTDPDTTYMRLVMQLDEKGEPLMPVIWLGQPCDTCVESGTALSCQHMWYQSPSWKDPERYERLKGLWKFSDATNARENFGMVPRETRVGFTGQMIDRFKSLPPYDDRSYRPPVVFLTADAACGGESDFALAAGYCVDSMLLLLFLDAARLDPSRTVQDERYRLRRAVDTIRSQQGMHNVPIVFIPENAPGMAGSYLWEHINDMQPIVVMEEFGSGRNNEPKRIGVPKTKQTTEEMRYLFVDAISTNSVRYSMRFASLPRDNTDGRATAQRKLVDQMIQYRPDVKKDYGEYHNDDQLIAVMMILLWRNRFYRSLHVPYRRFIEEQINASRI